MMSSLYAAPNVYNNSYVNGVLTNTTTTNKPSGFFLYAFSSSTATSIYSLGDDREGTNNRYGNYSFYECILFTTQLLTGDLNNVTRYLLNKYGLQYNYVPTSTINTDAISQVNADVRYLQISNINSTVLKWGSLIAIPEITYNNPYLMVNS